MTTKTQKYIFTGKLAGVATPMIHNQLIVEASVSDALCTALSMIDDVAFDFELTLHAHKDIKIDGTMIDVTATATKLPDAATLMSTMFKNRSAHTRAQAPTKEVSLKSIKAAGNIVIQRLKETPSIAELETKRKSSYGFTKATYDTWLRLTAAGVSQQDITKLFKVGAGHVHMYVTGKRNCGFDPNSELFKLAQSTHDSVRLSPTGKDVMQLIGHETMKLVDIAYACERYDTTPTSILRALNAHKSSNVRRLLAMSAIPSVD